MTILDELAESTKKRVKKKKRIKSFEEVKSEALKLEPLDFPFEKALSGNSLAFILECKKASPSKGLIDPIFDYLSIARDYDFAGADAISCLTEPEYFLGSDKVLNEITKEVSIPVLRKDFIIDPYMIYEARLLGASAVLLICSLLSEEELEQYLTICNTLGLSALVEAHNAEEVGKAVRVGARIIGVNNRNLKDFSVNTSNSTNLRNLVPDNILFVSESGVNNRNDILKLIEAGVDAVLIGETLMRANNKAEKLAELRGSNDPN